MQIRIAKSTRAVAHKPRTPALKPRHFPIRASVFANSRSQNGNTRTSSCKKAKQQSVWSWQLNLWTNKQSASIILFRWINVCTLQMLPTLALEEKYARKVSRNNTMIVLPQPYRLIKEDLGVSGNNDGFFAVLYWSVIAQRTVFHKFRFHLASWSAENTGNST